jgi:hypothetical protein
MRAIKQNGFGALVAAAALACAFGAGPAQAQTICIDPIAVASNLFNSIVTLADFDPTPSEQTCAKIASAYVSGCNKSVADAAKCNDTLNAARAQTKTAVCQTFVIPEERTACLQGVQAELSALDQATKDSATVGASNCADLSSSIVALCLGDSF